MPKGTEVTPKKTYNGKQRAIFIRKDTDNCQGCFGAVPAQWEKIPAEIFRGSEFRFFCDECKERDEHREKGRHYPFKPFQMELVWEEWEYSWGFKLSNVDPVRARIVRDVLCNCYMDSEDYKQRKNINPFLQGYSYNNPGEWLYVTFSCNNKEQIQTFIQYLYTQVFSPERYTDTKSWGVD